MAAKLIMGLLVVPPSAPGGPIIQALVSDRKPHAKCDERSWCQPADVALAALQKAQRR